jgi:hypothetical protein
VVAGESERRQRVKREGVDLEHLRARSGPFAAGKPCHVGDSNHAGSGSLGDVVDADEADHLHARRDLFRALASGRTPRILVVVDKPAGKAPLAAARLDRPAAQKDSAIDLDHHRGRDLRVVPKDEVVIRAALDFPAFDNARYELGAAVHAVMRHHSNSRDRRLQRGV